MEVDRGARAALERGTIDEEALREARELVSSAETAWATLHFTADIIARARRTFPAEPVRTLDALHLAFALAARDAVPGCVVLSLDHRIRRNAEALGFQVVP